MPVPDVPENPGVEAPVVQNAPKGSRFKAPVVPNTHKSVSLKVPLVLELLKNRDKRQVAKVLDPRDFVCIQALPSCAQEKGKVLARSRTVYRSSEPPREQVFWENYHRRQEQFAQGHFTPFGKPYRELGDILYIDPKKLTLYSLGQLAQEALENDVQEKSPKEVAEFTTNKYSFNPEFDSPEPVKRLSPPAETRKELRTLSKTLARSRHHVNYVKQGGEYFHILRQESTERKNMVKAAQQAQGMRWRTKFQPPESPSDVEESEEEINNCSLTEGNHLQSSGKKKKKKLLRSFAPVYTSVLIPNPPGAKREYLFQQLCAIHWLLEALTLESNRSMRSILTCWNPMDPGGCKKTVKEIEEEKLATCAWEIVMAKKKKYSQKVHYSPLWSKLIKIPTPGRCPLSNLSSPRGSTPCGSEISTILCAKDNVKISVASSEVMSESAQANSLTSFPSLQKVIQMMHEEESKDVPKQEDPVKKIGQQCLPVAQKNYRLNMPFIKDQESIIPRKQRPRMQSCHISSFIKSKSNLRANIRQKFTAVREEAACSLHDTLVSLERRQEERCFQKYQALKELKYFRRDVQRIRQLATRAEREPDEHGLNWFPVLLARLPESVKSDRGIQKILKKLEKYGKIPDLKINPDSFLKTLDDLQVWELCYPEIVAAVEFVRENIVQMPEEDFNQWFQTRVTPLSTQSSSF
ncbi:coiled-coil domain-containing protein 60 [Porphyrio hochstetteri]